jgi:flagellar hook-associated protein 2
MASVQSSGLNLDVQSLASQLVAADRAPMDARFARQEQTYTVQMSGLGTLKGALASFQDALKPLKTVGAFTIRAATTSDEDVLAVSADTTAAPGSYDIEVLDLAKANQLVSGIFSGPDEVVGTGTLSIGVGTSSFTLKIDSTNNTLAGIRDAINKSSDNTGVQATLIREQNGTHIVLTATKTGAANALTVTQFDGDGGLDKLVYDPNGTKNLTVKQPAQDAHITIAGFDHYSATNTVTGAIDGVTLNLTKKTEVGTPISITVTSDDASISKNVQNFVDAFNKLQKTFSTLNSFDATTGKTGALFGDSLLRQVDQQLRLDLSNTVSGVSASYNSLAAVGITRQTDGTLAVDTKKLEAAITNGNGAVAQLFGSTDGIAARLYSHIDATLATGAALDYRNTSIQAGLKKLQTDRANLDTRMRDQLARYVKQFSALDSMLTQMQQTSSYLSQQLANVPKPGSN